MQLFISILLGILATIIGGLPLGLVNLSVVEASMKEGRTPAMQIAKGAASVEVIFGLFALLAGSFIQDVIQGNPLLNYVVIGVLAISGIIFLTKSTQDRKAGQAGFSGFLKGAFLNLVSLQVFLYWLVAAAFLFTNKMLDAQWTSVVSFAAGIWMGKMLVLWAYAVYSVKIISKSAVLANNINRFMGLIFLLLATVHAFQI